MELTDLYNRLEPTSDHSVTVYDRPLTEVTNPHTQQLGTVNAGPLGVQAFLSHGSLADRWSAQLGGTYATIGDAVIALVKFADALPALAGERRSK
jgi:hypothetical protein